MRIEVCIEWGFYTSREWSVVPRVGDGFKVTGKMAGTYIVSEVVWLGDQEPKIIINLVKSEEHQGR